MRSKVGTGSRYAMRPMKDLTEGPVARHLVHIAGFIALSTTFQTLYFLADLYFVGRIGREAVAGVGLAGNLTFMVLALTQTLGVGATSLIAQAIGRREVERACLVFNQALLLASLTGLVFGIVSFAGRAAYAHGLAADAPTAALGIQYLDWFVPALVLQFPLVTMGSALRGIGDVQRPTAIQVATVLVNIALAPALIFGWVGPPRGVAGAALASFVAIVVGCLAFAAYFRRDTSVLRFRAADWTPQLHVWRDMLRVGLPAGGEFALMSVYMVLVYATIRPFGAAAQAGFGIGLRIMQSLFLPTVAVAFAAAPVAGQNFGARRGDRVRQTFYAAAGLSAALMLVTSVLCHAAPETLVRAFNADPAVVDFGAEYLRIISWNFVASGLLFVSSSIFQGMGNTLPPLANSAGRTLVFAVCASHLSRRASFAPRELWYLSVAVTVLGLVTNFWLLRREFARKLAPMAPAAIAPVVA
jgi:putative MATE family efflux protein